MEREELIKSYEGILRLNRSRVRILILSRKELHGFPQEQEKINERLTSLYSENWFIQKRLRKLRA